MFRAEVQKACRKRKGCREQTFYLTTVITFSFIRVLVLLLFFIYGESQSYRFVFVRLFIRDCVPCFVDGHRGENSSKHLCK